MTLTLLLLLQFAEAFNQGLSLYRQKQYKESLPFLEQAARLDPKDYNAQFLYGAALSEVGKNEDALKAWRKALALKPDNLRLLQAMSIGYSKGRYFGEAAKTAESALQRKPGDLNLFLLAIKAYQDFGDYDAASRIAAEAAKRFPASARAHFEHGFHLQKSGDTEAGIAEIRRAIELDPAYEEPHFFYGDLLLKQGDAAGAVPPLRAAISIRNDYIPARVTLARALVSLQKFDDAKALLSETITLDPTQPQPHLILSQIYFRQGDETRAREEKELSLKLRRERPEVLEALQARPFPK